MCACHVARPDAGNDLVQAAMQFCIAHPEAAVADWEMHEVEFMAAFAQEVLEADRKARRGNDTDLIEP